MRMDGFLIRVVQVHDTLKMPMFSVLRMLNLENCSLSNRERFSRNLGCCEDLLILAMYVFQRETCSSLGIPGKLRMKEVLVGEETFVSAYIDLKDKSPTGAYRYHHTFTVVQLHDV